MPPRLNIILVTVFSCSGVGLAQTYEVTRHVVGGSSVNDAQGGTYRLSGSVGQVGVESLAGEPFSLRGGFHATSSRSPCGDDSIDPDDECFVPGIPAACSARKRWIGTLEAPGDTEWSYCANWFEGAIPANGDNVCIPASANGDVVVYAEGEVDLTSLACGKNLVIDGSSFPWPIMGLNSHSVVHDDLSLVGNAVLNVHDFLLVDGPFDWRGGRIGGTGTTELTDGMSLTQSSVDIWQNHVSLTGGTGYSNGKIVSLSYGASFRIGPDATYNYAGNSSIFYGGNSSVDVEGTLIRSGGDGTATVFAPIDNSGLVLAQTGRLVMQYGGEHSGSFVGDPATTLAFLSNHEFMPSSLLSTPTLETAGGESNVHGVVNIGERIRGTGASWTFADDATILDYGDELYVERGIVRFEAPIDAPINFDSVTITTPGESAGNVEFDTGQPVNVHSLQMLTGTLNGTSPINVSGTLSWTNGTFFSGGAITADGPVVFNATSSSRTIARPFFVNSGATAHSGFGVSGTGHVYNAEDSTFDLRFNSGGIGSGDFTNYGSIIRSSGDGQISLSVDMENHGLIHNQSGTLSLSGGGTHYGDIVSDPGTTLRVFGSGHSFEPTSTLTAETLELGAFNSEFHGTLDVTDAIVCEGCAFTFAPDAEITDYGRDLHVMYGAPHIEAPTDRSISFDTVTVGPNFNPSAVYFDTGQTVEVQTFALNANSNFYGSSALTVYDQFTWIGGSFLPGGRITLYGASTVHSTSSARTLYRMLDNYGTLTLIGLFSFSATASIHNMPGGVIDVRYGGGGSVCCSGLIHNEGTLIKSTTDGAAGLPAILNEGIVDIQQGSLSFNTTYHEYRQTAGATILHSTELTFSGFTPVLMLEGGVLTGTGTINGSVDSSAGTVAPGERVGDLHITGDFDQGADGTLAIDLGDSGPRQADSLTVDGTATLSGTLRVSNLDGFVPQPGMSFTVLTASAINGTFDVEPPAFYEVEYDATEMRLVAVLTPEDIVADGRIDLRDYQAFQNCFGGAGAGPSSSCPPGIDADVDDDGDVDLDDFGVLGGAWGL